MACNVERKNAERNTISTTRASAHETIIKNQLTEEEEPSG